MKFFSLHGGHSNLSHGKGDPEEFVEAAISKGMNGIGFSDHMLKTEKDCYIYNGERNSVGLKKFPKYLQEIRRLKRKYSSKIKILLGFEVDYFPDEEKYIRDFIAKYTFDYLVGSVHFVNGIPIDQDYETYDTAVNSCGGLLDFYIQYYKTVQKMIRMKCFQVIGHIDIVKIFNRKNNPESLRLKKIIYETLRLMRKYKCLLDVNVAGYIKPKGELYPNQEILKMSKEAGVEVSYGDDSHDPKHVGRFFKRALAEIQKAGYKKFSILKKKNRGEFLRKVGVF